MTDNQPEPVEACGVSGAVGAGGVPSAHVGDEVCPQPADAKFWAVHVHGPDDVIPFDTEDQAECYAAAILDLTKPGGVLAPSSPLDSVISAHVIPPADPVVSPVQGEAEPSDYCPRDHGCSLPTGHDGDCYLTAALCECTECEAKAQWEGDDAPPGLAVELLRLRERHVDGVVKSRINQRGGDVDGEQIVGWDAEVVAAWDREYPACAARIAEALERAS